MRISTNLTRTLYAFLLTLAYTLPATSLAGEGTLTEEIKGDAHLS